MPKVREQKNIFSPKINEIKRKKDQLLTDNKNHNRYNETNKNKLNNY